MGNIVFSCDSFYEIGNSHAYCEDYAFHRQLGDYCWAIVSDGCSGADYTDIGARLLVRKADAILRENVKKGFDIYDMMHKDFVDDVLFQDRGDACIEMSKTLGLPICSLNATLWIAICRKTGEKFQWIVGGWGDGQVAMKFKNGTIRVLYSNFPSGAPFYPAYRYQDAEKKYVEEFGTKQILGVVDVVPGIEEHETFEQEVSYKDNFFYSNNDEVQSITVMTDGFRSYDHVDHQRVGSLPWAASRLLDFKSIEGVFVQRRMKALARRDIKEKITHFDDLGAATILMMEEPSEVTNA